LRQTHRPLASGVVERTKETEIQRVICDYLALKRYFFVRLNNIPALYRGDAGELRFRKMGKYARPGLADILVVHKGKAIFLEVKNDTGKQSADQIDFGSDAILVGAQYLLYRKYEDLQFRKTRRFLTIDSKGTEAKFDGTDYIGLTLNYVDIDNNWHFMSCRMKLSTARSVDLMYNWYATHGLEVIGYERTSFTEGMKAYLDSEARRRNKFLPLVELSHRQTNKQTRIQQSLEPRYNRKAIFHLTVGGVNQCADLEEELLSFPKSPNDDDSAAYQVEIAPPPAGGREDVAVSETRRRLTENQAR
jgi:hypothetical protein